jgi:hypothetical protein
MTQLFEELITNFSLNKKQEGFYLMKVNNFLPKLSEEKFYETFFGEVKAKMIMSSIKLQQFYEEFKNRTFNTNFTPSPDVEIKIHTRFKEFITKIVQGITESNQIDLEEFFSQIFSNFTKEYPNIEKYTPNELFPFIKVKGTNSNDFIHHFVPKEVEINFKSNEIFQKNQKMNVNIIWDSEINSIEKDKSHWSNFEKFLSFYFDKKRKYNLKKKSFEEGFTKTKNTLIESNKIVRRLKSILESFVECNDGYYNIKGLITLHGPSGTGKKMLIKGKTNLHSSQKFAKI